MDFTPQELKLIEQLRKQDRQWRWARWALLAMGVLSAADTVLSGYLVYRAITESAHDQIDSMTVFLIVLFSVKGCFLFLFSVWCFVTAISKWHGDANRMLLLKLLDAQRAA